MVLISALISCMRVLFLFSFFYVIVFSHCYANRICAETKMIRGTHINYMVNASHFLAMRISSFVPSLSLCFSFSRAQSPILYIYFIVTIQRQQSKHLSNITAKKVNFCRGLFLLQSQSQFTLCYCRHHHHFVVPLSSQPTCMPL